MRPHRAGSGVHQHPHQRALVLIGALKLVKAAFFIALAFGLLRMLHHDVYLYALHVVEALRFDPDRLVINKLLQEVSIVNDHRLRELSAFTFGYAALDVIEGTGLILEKRWAEYVTLVITAAFLPIEMVKFAHHPNIWTFLLTFVNLIVVLYLAWVVRPRRHSSEKSSVRTVR